MIRYMTYNGEGLEQGMYTLEGARAKWNSVEFDAETKTISVDDLRVSNEPRDVAERVAAVVGDDGTGDIGVIVRQALKDDPAATDEDIIEIIREAREDARAAR